MDPARAMRLRRVVEQEGQAYIGRLPELKYLIAPFIARNAREQRDVYRIWEEFVAEYEADWEEWIDAPEEYASAEQQQAWYIRYRKWILAAVLLPLLAGVAYFFWEGGVEPIIEQENKVALGQPKYGSFPLGDTVFVENLTDASLSEADSATFFWELYNSTDETLILRDSSWDFSWAVNGELGQGLRLVLSTSSPKFAAGNNTAYFESNIYCSDPPFLTEDYLTPTNFELGESNLYSISQPEEGVVYKWQVDGHEPSVGLTYEHRFTNPGSYFVQVEAFKGADSTYCYSIIRRQVQVQAPGKPFLEPLPLQRDEASQYLQVANWVWGLVLWPLLISLYFWRRWRRRGKHEETTKMEEELAAAYPISESGPYYIPYQDQEAKINVPADFYRIADQLRLREAGGRSEFDSTASVSATVKGGGYPSWREKAIHKPAEYLLLLPYTHEFEQRECLLRRLGDFLTEHEAAITTYYHRGDFRHFWNKDYPDGWSAARLLSRYQDYRLIILGTGRGLVDPFESAQPRLLPDLEKIFHRWSRRLLLTTEAVVDWSWEERLLYQHFLLYPADTEGMRLGSLALNQVEEYEPGQYDKWTQELERHRSEPGCRYRNWTNVADHRDYLSDDPELFRWLCGLAVAAQPDFRLTIAIGRALGIQVTHDRLLRLSRIPWLAGNSPDTQLRLALIDELSKEDEVEARLAVLAELEAVASQVEGSFAHSEWVANRAVQQFSLEPTNPAYKQQIRDLRQLGLFSGDQLQELEHGLQTGGPSTTSATELPQLDKWLDTPEPQPWFTTDLVWGLLLCLITLIGSLACWDYNQAAHDYNGGELASWQRAANVDDEAIRLNNIAVLSGRGLFQQESFQQFDYLQGEWSSAENNLFDAIRLRNGNYPLADSNLLALSYNRRARYLNFFLADSTEYPVGLEHDESIILKDDQGSVDAFMDDPQSSWSLAFSHAIGLMAFYESGIADYSPNDMAPFYAHLEDFGDDFLLATLEEFVFLNQARNGTFFDSLSQTMPVNLKTLLLPYLNAGEDYFSQFLGIDLQQGTDQPNEQIDFPTTTTDPVPDALEQNLAGANQLSPFNGGLLRLYFEPGQPGPMSPVITSSTSYEERVATYLERAETIENIAIEEIATEQAQNGRTQIRDFFQAELPFVEQEFALTLAELLDNLNRGGTYSVYLSGEVPGENGYQYGRALLERRLVEVVNSFNSYEGGSLQPYLQDRRLNLIPSTPPSLTFISQPKTYDLENLYRNYVSLSIRENSAPDDRTSLYEEWARDYLGSDYYEEHVVYMRPSTKSGRLLREFRTSLDRISRFPVFSVHEVINRFDSTFLFGGPQIGLDGTIVENVSRGYGETGPSNNLFLLGNGSGTGVAELDNLMRSISQSTKVILIANWEYDHPNIQNSPSLSTELNQLTTIFRDLNVTDVSVYTNVSKAELDRIFREIWDAGNEKSLANNNQFLTYFSGYATVNQEGMSFFYAKDSDPLNLESSFSLLHVIENPNSTLTDDEAPQKLVTLLETEILYPQQQSNINPIRPQMVNVPGGTFTMGDTFREAPSNESLLHEVAISAFQMGRYEVTFEEYNRFCDATGKEKPTEMLLNTSIQDSPTTRGRYPVANVSWYDAVSYCNWLSKSLELEEVYSLADPTAQEAWQASGFSSNIDGQQVIRGNTNGYRLPTEAEWEYAASYTGESERKSRFGNGQDIARSEEINFNATADYEYSISGEFRGQATIVGSLGTTHPLGLTDLSGNVWEWCGDWIEAYTGGNKSNPSGAESGNQRAIRGGSWNDPAIVCRATARGSFSPAQRDISFGFRLVRAVRN